MGKTTKLRSTIPLILITFLIATGLKAQNVTVAGATTVNGPYATLGAAFTAINGEAQTSKIITISIIGNTTETATATLNASDWKSLSISPAGAYKISGSVANALVNLSGATAVTIDGLNSGGNSLTFDNAMTGATSTILFDKDCKNIAIKNCRILGASSSASTGTVLFGTSTTGTGNDLIKISNCTIDSSSSGTPTNGICSIGTSTAGKENSTDSIVNSSIANFFNASLASSGISLGTGNTAWTISGCRFFQGAKRTYTSAFVHTAISVASGDGHSITNNIIGYANEAGTNMYTMTSASAVRYIGIDVSVGTTTTTSIQGNTITAIELTTTSNDNTGYGAWCGIRAAAGNVTIGDLSPNIIGDTTGADLVKLTSTAAAALVGINAASTGIVTIKNNKLGGLSSLSSVLTIGPGIMGVSISASASILTVAGNRIGNATANNIRAGSPATTLASSFAYGINFSTTPASTTISKNTIQNLISYGISSSFVRGITTATGIGNTSVMRINGNTINKLTTNGTQDGLVSGQCGAAGITLGVGTTDTVANNIISDISLTSTEAVASYAVGIAVANVTNSLVQNNRIWNISNLSTATATSAPGVVAGIAIRSADLALTVQNNMISLGTGSTNNIAIVGIMSNNGTLTPAPTIENIFHNTVNISGTVTSGALPSFGYYRGDFSATARTITVDVRNNIFTNSRSGGTGAHYAIANNYGAAVSSAGWNPNASNYNVLNAANANTIGWWGLDKTFIDWQTSSSSDANSYSGYTITYANPASDLHLNMGTVPTVVESRAQVIAGITTDYDGDKRPGPIVSVNGGGLIPDIGADEIDGVIIDLIRPTITYTVLPPSCDTATRILTAVIADSGKVPTTGILQPRIYYRKNKNSWVSTQGVLSSGTASNGNWNFTLHSSVMGGLAAGDTVSYFVVAQDLSGNGNANPSIGIAAIDVNTITTYPTTPNTYPIKPSPTISSVTGGSVCDSGKVTLNATASTGSLNWYNVASGGSSLGTNNSYTTGVIKATTPYYVDATNNGCTSPRKSALAVVNHSTTSTVTPVTACDKYTWKTKTYTISGTYRDTIPNAAGCDSVIVLNLTINHSTTSTLPPETACDIFTLKGKTYTTSGTYYDTIPNKAGCDSIIVMNLTIIHSTTHSDTVKACAAYTWNAHLYTTSGVYKDTIPNKAGCDSIMTLQLTITHVNPTVTVVDNVITADSIVDSYQWINCATNLPILGETGKVYTATAPSGSYAVIETKNGCVDTSNCIPIVTTGIASLDKDQLYIYPNPGTGMYTLSLPEKATITIVNLTGEVVFNEQVSKGNHSLDLLKTANGVYMVHVTTNQTHQVLKLIKQE